MRMLKGRLAKLERGDNDELSEAARAWLGMRPALTHEEFVKWSEEQERRGPVDVSGWSPKLREWLGV